ncbi:nucleoside deaminase [Rhodovibrio sodomensis]|uniref:nucleoside deaminase n=1 Tax=Rhodovibrio sodomensis TaxID=1088 RepID=UPI00308468DA
MSGQDQDQDQAFIEQAIELARRAIDEQAGGPFGAVIVLNGRAIGQGNNRVLGTCDPTAHAEVVAIRQACRETGQFHLPEATLYTSCEPCPMCLFATHWARIPRIVFAANREDAAEIGFSDAEQYQYLRMPVSAFDMHQIARDAARQAMRDWAASAGSRLY